MTFFLAIVALIAIVAFLVWQGAVPVDFFTDLVTFGFYVLLAVGVVLLTLVVFAFIVASKD